MRVLGVWIVRVALAATWLVSLALGGALARDADLPIYLRALGMFLWAFAILASVMVARSIYKAEGHREKHERLVIAALLVWAICNLTTTMIGGR